MWLTPNVQETLLAGLDSSGPAVEGVGGKVATKTVVGRIVGSADHHLAQSTEEQT